jgi:hypothetical protein
MRNTQAKALVFIETSWLKRLKSEVIYRYELPIHSFKSIADVGMWVSKHPVDPLNVVKIKDLPSQLMARNIELRVLDSLLPLKDAWNSTLHTSGIKLRNAKGWI